MEDSKKLRLVDANEDDLRRIVRDELAAILEGSAPDNDDSVLDKAGAAKFLKCSTATIDTLCRDKGLPFGRLGDHKRFIKAQLIEFVKAQGSK